MKIILICIAYLSAACIAAGVAEWRRHGYRDDVGMLCAAIFWPIYMLCVAVIVSGKKICVEIDKLMTSYEKTTKS